MTFRVDVEKRGIHTIARFHGDVDLHNVNDVRDQLIEIIDQTRYSLIIDMAKVNYIDSSGLGAMVTVQRKMKAKSGNFAFLGIPDDLQKVLKLSDLDKYFVVYEDDSEIPDSLP